MPSPEETAKLRELADKLAEVQKNPPVEPDHSGVAEAKRAEEAKVRARRAERKFGPTASGCLPGRWFQTGSSLLNLEAVARIDLPPPGEDPFVVLYPMHGSQIHLYGDDASDFLEALNLTPSEKPSVTPRPPELPKLSENPPKAQEDGRLVSEADKKAEAERAAENERPRPVLTDDEKPASGQPTNYPETVNNPGPTRGRNRAAQPKPPEAEKPKAEEADKDKPAS